MTTNLNIPEETPSNWKAVAGYAYVLICLFDFLVMPVAVHMNRVDTKSVIVDTIESHGLTAGIDLIDHAYQGHQMNQWEPVTLRNGALFHISFGAILTGVAVSRNLGRRIREADK